MLPFKGTLTPDLFLRRNEYESASPVAAVAPMRGRKSEVDCRKRALTTPRRRDISSMQHTNQHAFHSRLTNRDDNSNRNADFHPNFNGDEDFNSDCDAN